MRGRVDPAPPAGRGARRGSFAVVTLGYLAVTVGEAMLAPAYPLVAGELGLGLRAAGFAFGVLAAGIAVGNILGGAALTRWGIRTGGLLGVGLTLGGAAAAAASRSGSEFLAAQGILGLGSGAYFAPGLSAVGALAGPRRRGLAIGFFGVAFSGGLAVAATLVALAGPEGWREAFVVVAVLAGLGATALVPARLPATPAPSAPASAGPRGSLRFPLAVGVVGAVSQYGTVSFIPAFAVGEWGLSPWAAATALAVARILSVPSKLIAGHAADRLGGASTAVRVGVLLATLGIWWTVFPGPAGGLWAAVAFAAAVGGLFPVANLLALEGALGRGVLLGGYRAVQIGAGAAASAAIGVTSSAVGLRPALAAAAIAPLVLLPLARRPAAGS